MRALKSQQAEPAPDKMPAHVAIIMDGNGRWAKSRGLPRAAGHKKGADALKQVIEGCGALGLQYLTLYAFSAENWQRPDTEISDLMNLLRHYLKKEITSIHKNNIRLNIIGDRSKLAGDIRQDIAEAEALTARTTGFSLNIALSYGGRQELLRAIRTLAAEIAEGKIEASELSETYVAAALDTHDIPDPDLLIRTGGEQRLSNFLLWQSAYTELYFMPVLWPDFTLEHLQEACAEYARRERRYGRTDG